MRQITPRIGKGGWQDWNLVPFAVENDYIVVTLNRRDFLKQHANLEIHPGLVILMPQAPMDKRLYQAELFEKALEAFVAMNDDLVNKVMEVLEDGSVHVRGWRCGRRRNRAHRTIRSGADGPLRDPRFDGAHSLIGPKVKSAPSEESPGRCRRGLSIPDGSFAVNSERSSLHPVVLPHVSHFMQVPLRTSVKLPHSPQASPS